MEDGGNNLNNNPHLRGANQRFLAGGENPALYTVIPSVISRDYPGLVELDGSYINATRMGYLGEQDRLTREYGVGYRRSRGRPMPDQRRMQRGGYPATSSSRSEIREEAQYANDAVRRFSETIDISGPDPKVVDLSKLPL